MYMTTPGNSARINHNYGNRELLTMHMRGNILLDVDPESFRGFMGEIYYLTLTLRVSEDPYWRRYIT